MVENCDAPGKEGAYSTHVGGRGFAGHTLRTDRWRYIRYRDGSEELYDHRADPNEWNNLAKDPNQARRISQLRRLVPEAAKRMQN